MSTNPSPNLSVPYALADSVHINLPEGLYCVCAEYGPDICMDPKRVTSQIPRHEIRVVDPVTGGAKGQKDVQLSMCPPAFLEDLGRVYAMGASKYDRNNWKKGYAWSLSVDALMRHLLRVLDGEWTDTESGLPHIIHVAWHCATLHTFHREGLGTNDVW